MKSLLALLTVFSFNVVSVEVPHTFNNGTPAYADEINDNFEAVSNGVNTNGARISDIEAPKEVIQMFCTSSGQGFSVQTFLENSRPAYCNIPSYEIYRDELLIQKVIDDGWKLVSPLNYNNYYFIFEK